MFGNLIFGKRLSGNSSVLIVDFEQIFADWDNLKPYLHLRHREREKERERES